MMLSIIIPSNVLDTNFESCLRSVETASTTEAFELIVVLDGVAKSGSFFEQFHLPNLTLIELPDNQGPAFARNQGAKAASGDVLFFMDADVSLHSDSIGKIRSHFCQADATDAVIGSYDDTPDYLSVVSRFRNLLHHYTHQHACDKANTFWGACGAIRKDVFLAADGFDTSYNKPSVEDIELGYRLIEAGHSIRLKKDIQVKHLKQWTLRNMLHTDVMRRAVPWTKLLFRHGRVGHRDLNLKLREKLAAVLVMLAFACVIASQALPQLLALSAAVMILLILLNSHFYTFLSQRLPPVQLLLAVVLHWLYYLSAITGFVLGCIAYFVQSRHRADYDTAPRRTAE